MQLELSRVDTDGFSQRCETIFHWNGVPLKNSATPVGAHLCHYSRKNLQFASRQISTIALRNLNAKQLSQLALRCLGWDCDPVIQAEYWLELFVQHSFSVSLMSSWPLTAYPCLYLLTGCYTLLQIICAPRSGSESHHLCRLCPCRCSHRVEISLVQVTACACSLPHLVTKGQDKSPRLQMVAGSDLVLCYIPLFEVSFASSLTDIISQEGGEFEAALLGGQRVSRRPFTLQLPRSSGWKFWSSLDQAKRMFKSDPDLFLTPFSPDEAVADCMRNGLLIQVTRAIEILWWQ